MVPIIVFAALTLCFGLYLRRQGPGRPLAQALLLAGLATGVWVWFLVFRLSSGGLFADGGAIVWTAVLIAVCYTIVRRALASSRL